MLMAASPELSRLTKERAKARGKEKARAKERKGWSKGTCTGCGQFTAVDSCVQTTGRHAYAI
eukprot:SAG31_NODE_861_length_11418_cov_5.107430_12_plen_62_part_00